MTLKHGPQRMTAPPPEGGLAQQQGWRSFHQQTTQLQTLKDKKPDNLQLGCG
eukprot:CAMPEP_0174307064 /NCGR_PEP_ID=MMETSP0810-20121108/879_1 /TAXON_ID=73025 ORGANISM="Eutreptiella gymnastica-like, Strain CCMP1594" /NCGR_SAMPLE_ID=MMETSP0810 /ASSEMBLY_ACC=CAM_ASM_000659 /LENGTH=51 /DNA_ID=CAMNT_0015414009 /DNA_START=870 /DNA_END=1021 /DNA_ORIENTATION=-